MLYMKVVKRINLRVLTTRKKKFCPLLDLYEVMDANSTFCSNNFTINVQTIMLHTLNLYSDMCQLYLNKTGEKGFPGGAVVENLPANSGGTGSSPGLGGSHMPRSN